MAEDSKNEEELTSLKKQVEKFEQVLQEKESLERKYDEYADVLNSLYKKGIVDEKGNLLDEDH